MVPSPGFQSRFFVLANENRTQDAGHALLRQGRNPKVRKNSGVIGLGGELAFVVAGPVRLPSPAALVSGGPGDLVGLGVEHRVEDLRHLLGDQPVEPGLEQVLVDLYDVLGHGSVSWLPIAVFCFGE